MDVYKKLEPQSSDEQKNDGEDLEKSPAINLREALIVTRDKLPNVIEKPCLEACIDLYDKNIRTVASNSNIQYATIGPHESRGLFIHIDYNSLSGENKRIAHELQNKKLVEINTNDTYGGITKKVIIKGEPEKTTRSFGRPVYNIQAFEEKSVRIAEMFQDQDVLYGRYKPEEVVQQILDTENIQDEETGKKFLLQNNIFTENDTINPEGVVEFLSKKNDVVIIDDPKHHYRTINFGKVYDEETGEFWANNELLQKHREFITKNGMPIEEDFQEPVEPRITIKRQ